MDREPSNITFSVYWIPALAHFARIGRNDNRLNLLAIYQTQESTHHQYHARHSRAVRRRRHARASGHPVIASGSCSTALRRSCAPHLLDSGSSSLGRNDNRFESCEPSSPCRSPRIVDNMLATAVLFAAVSCPRKRAPSNRQRLLFDSHSTQSRSAVTGFRLSLASLARQE
jgi:hypothetical protein